MFEADLHRQVRRATLAGCGIAAVMLATAASAGEAGSAGCAAAHRPASGTAWVQVNVGESERTALVHVPASYTHGRATPLIPDLQASGITPENQLAITRFDEAAEKAGFIVALPAAEMPFEGGGATWNVPVQEDGPDDLGFIEALIDRLEETYCVDRDRIYAAGFSGGARLASALACRMPDRLAAISAVGGIRAPDPRRQACTPSATTIAVLAIHSVDDPVNVYYGDPATTPAYWMHGVEDAMAGWAEHLGCGGIETMAVTQNVERREYRGCGTTGALTLYALRGSGHTWPGSSFAFPDYLGATEANIDATVLSLDWFERHRRAGNSGS